MTSISKLVAMSAGALLVAGTGVAVLAPPARHPAAPVARAVNGSMTSAGGSGSASAVGPLASSGGPAVLATPPPLSGAGAPSATGLVPSDTPVPADTVARSGSIAVEVPKGHFGGAFSAAADVARQVGGFVVSTEMSTSPGLTPRNPGPTPVPDGANVALPPVGVTPGLAPVTVPSAVPSGILELRVPGARFDDARHALEGLGTIRSEQLAGQDAGGQLADLNARLADLTASQTGLRALAAKTTSTADLLQIQAQLSSVQQQIDSISAQVNRLNNSVALATIDVRVSEPYPVVAASTSRSVLHVRLAQAGRALQSVVGGMIVVAAYAFPLGVLALLGGGCWRIVRRRRILPAA